MECEFADGDMIAEIGAPRIYVVVGVMEKSRHCILQEIDMHGSVLDSPCIVPMELVNGGFVKVGGRQVHVRLHLG